MKRIGRYEQERLTNERAEYNADIAYREEFRKELDTLFENKYPTVHFSLHTMNQEVKNAYDNMVNNRRTEWTLKE